MRARWSPGRRTAASVLFSANLGKDWERDRQRARSIASSIDGGAPVALTTRKGPDSSPVVSPDGRQIAYVGYDDDGSATRHPALRDEPRRLQHTRPHRRPRPRGDQPGLVVPTAALSTSSTTNMAAIASRASGSTARSATSQPASPAAASIGPIAAASSACRATAELRSPSAIPARPSDIALAIGREPCAS